MKRGLDHLKLFVGHRPGTLSMLAEWVRIMAAVVALVVIATAMIYLILNILHFFFGGT
jgi:hypothetical protein